MRKKMLYVVFSLIVILALTASPVAAVTDGTLDGNGHPAVVLLLMEVGGAAGIPLQWDAAFPDRPPDRGPLHQ